MNYHNIKHDDMNNGSGLRVTLFVSGCDHYCKECQNPETWKINSGILFDDEAVNEIIEQLDKEYISGITFSGGDPLNKYNLETIYNFVKKIRKKYDYSKNIWIYTGYTWEQIMNPVVVTRNIDIERDNILNMRKELVSKADVLVDGIYVDDLADVNYHWAGSTNQRVIDVQSSITNNKVILLKE